MNLSAYNLLPDIPPYWSTQVIVKAINAARDANSRAEAIERSFDVLCRKEAEVALAGLKLAEAIADILHSETTKIMRNLEETHEANTSRELERH